MSNYLPKAIYQFPNQIDITDIVSNIMVLKWNGPEHLRDKKRLQPYCLTRLKERKNVCKKLHEIN